MGNQQVNEAVLSTIKSLTKKSLNQRTTPPVSDDIDSLKITTPKEFLMGCLETDSTSFNNFPADVNLRKSLKLSQKFAKIWWKLLLKEYKPLHIAHAKWYKETTNGIEDGILVRIFNFTVFTESLVVYKNIQLPNRDRNIALSVDIRKTTGLLERPIIDRFLSYLNRTPSMQIILMKSIFYLLEENTSLWLFSSEFSLKSFLS